MLNFSKQLPIIYLTRQSEGECTSPVPAKILSNYKKVVVLNFCRGQDGYFLLFFISRIATINNAMVKITINSSYVLISIILSIRLGTDASTSHNYPGKYIIFAMLSLFGSTFPFHQILLIQLLFGFFIHSNRIQIII